MKILGIDPGFERIGIAILEKSETNETILFSKCFKTSAKLDFTERLHLIGLEVKGVIKKFKPEILGIESLFLNTNQKTAMRVAEARGVILYECVQAGLKIVEVSPLQVKMAIVGYGRASKEQILKMIKIITKISDDKKLDDEIDAIAVGLTASNLIRE